MCKSYSIQVCPLFAPHHSNDAKIAFEQRVTLKTIYKASPSDGEAQDGGALVKSGWISHTSYMLLVNSTKSVTIQVDPSQLPTGHHHAVVAGYMAGQEEWGPLFEIPVTIVKPRSSTLSTEVPKNGTNSSAEVKLGVLTFQPASRIRHFLVPPPGALYAEVFLKDLRGGGGNDEDEGRNGEKSPSAAVGDPDSLESSSSATDASNSSSDDFSERIFVCHALQLLDNQPYRDNDDRRYYRLERRGQIGTGGFRVVPGHTLELCLSRYWSTVAPCGDVKVEVTVVYRGISPNSTAAGLFLRGGCRVSPRLHLSALLSEVEVCPQGKFTHYSRSIRPVKKGRVLPLGERDVEPDDPESADMDIDTVSGKIENEYGGNGAEGKTLYQLVLEYRVVLEGGCDVCFQWDGLQGVLYESRFHCQFFTLYNACNQRVFHGDAFDGRKMCKISGGEGGVYMVRLDIRHPTPTILENLADLPCVTVRSLTKAVPLTFYYRKSDCLIGSAQGK